MIKEFQAGIRRPAGWQQASSNTAGRFQLAPIVQAGSFHGSRSKQAGHQRQIFFVELTLPIACIKLNHAHAIPVVPIDRDTHNRSILRCRILAVDTICESLPASRLRIALPLTSTC